jgi:hypothetical protein
MEATEVARCGITDVGSEHVDVGSSVQLTTVQEGGLAAAGDGMVPGTSLSSAHTGPSDVDIREMDEIGLNPSGHGNGPAATDFHHDCSGEAANSGIRSSMTVRVPPGQLLGASLTHGLIPSRALPFPPFFLIFLV